MARSPFSIYTRKGTDGKILFCARFYEEGGKPIKSVTLWKAKSPTSAARLAEALLQEGVLPRDANPMALDFLRLFWTRDSDYVQGRALRGVILSERYLDESILVINKHLAEPLKGKRFLDITARFLEQTILSMARNGLGARRINAAMQAVKVPYAWFCRQHRIINQLTIVEKAREHPKQRGVLTAAEFAAFNSVQRTYRKPRYRAYVPFRLFPNMLARQFTVSEPNKSWVVDTTFIRTHPRMALLNGRNRTLF
jgi:hypothetical protein